MMSSPDDYWITSAMTDDRLVAELLLRLQKSDGDASSLCLSSPPPMRWGKRKPRSKAAAGTAGVEASASVSEKDVAVDPTRWSPTTPLSWSEGREESRFRFDSTFVVRSKGLGTNEATNAFNKTSRKKKTFAELIEEEVFLLKERSCLKRELATLHVTLNEQRSLNQNLKRIKMNSGATSNGLVIKSTTTSPCLTEAPTPLDGSCCAPKHIAQNDRPSPESFPRGGNARDQERDVFLLPDLNMMPEEEGFSQEALLGPI
ncbi:hypothetical protein AKJ16_DCAP09447 [Drosera capensis]